MTLQPGEPATGNSDGKQELASYSNYCHLRQDARRVWLELFMFPQPRSVVLLS